MPAEQRTQIMKDFLPKLLVGHVGTPEEVAEAYIFAMKVSKLTIWVTSGGRMLSDDPILVPVFDWPSYHCRRRRNIHVKKPRRAGGKVKFVKLCTKL